MREEAKGERRKPGGKKEGEEERGWKSKWRKKVRERRKGRKDWTCIRPKVCSLGRCHPEVSILRVMVTREQKEVICANNRFKQSFKIK